MSGGYVVNEDGSLQRPRVDVRLPELGAVAFQFNEIGAKYAARYYLDLVEYAWATGDTAPMRNFATDECTPCTSMADTVDNLYASGGWAHHLGYKILQVTKHEPVSQDLAQENTYGVAMDVKEIGGTVYSDSTMNVIEDKDISLGIFLHWDDSSWHVIGISALEGSES